MLVHVGGTRVLRSVDKHSATIPELHVLFDTKTKLHRRLISTAFTAGLCNSSGFDTYDPFFQEQFLAMKDNVPARRLGTEEEVASTVTFLLSPAAAYITGETVRVDGASSLWRLHWEVPDHDKLPPYGGRSPTDSDERVDEG